MGATGARGATGAKGLDGVGISSVVVSSDGSLIVTLSDGSTQNAGVVRDHVIEQQVQTNTLSIESVRSMATVALILAACSLLWNLVSAVLLLLKLKKEGSLIA